MFSFNLQDELTNTDLNYALMQNNIDLQFDADNFEADYKLITMSHFDRVLTEEEYCEQELVCFTDVENNPALLPKLDAIFHNFLNVYRKLFELNNGDVYIQARCPVVVTSDVNVFMRHMLNGLKELPLCTVIFPHLKVCIDLSYDLTHDVFIHNNAPINTQQISEIVTSNKLYVIA